MDVSEGASGQKATSLFVLDNSPDCPPSFVLFDLGVAWREGGRGELFSVYFRALRWGL